MAFNKDQFTALIVEVLTKIDKCCLHSVNLLLGTAAQESAFGTYIEQVGTGPALGVFQMEPTTERDMWTNYINYRNGLVDKIYSACGVLEPNEFALKTNLAYQAIMTRCHYLRVPEALPETVEGYAYYWKKYYNTIKGKGTEVEFIKNYNKYVSEIR